MNRSRRLQTPAIGGRSFRTTLGHGLLAAALMVTLCSVSLFGRSHSVADNSGDATWHMLGPSGGNARALAYDPSNPDHILLGTGGGVLFESFDRGAQWHLFARLGPSHDLNLENIVFDPSHPKTIYVGGWSITGQGGGFFVTRDGGESWSEPAALRDKSIQALAVAASDPRILVAGSLDGLYRSHDRGESWERITPSGHPDLKNFESVAIDPHDPQVIYAGTWHLPWKTTDGGHHWSNIKHGVIDDSDVFSIILSHADSQVVFASACSGIYSSHNGGELFSKVRGIPSSARRTRVLQQDPLNANVVYAGTTKGLWKSTDGGVRFRLITPSSFILNDVMVDPRDSNRVLIATDRGGVYVSNDAGKSFRPSNEGFSQRKVAALQAGSGKGGDLYLSVLNDKEFGGVFQLSNGQWRQLNRGLGDDEVLDLKRSPDGALVAATNHGIYRYDTKSGRWLAASTVTSGSQPLGLRSGKAKLRKTSARSGGSARNSARGANFRGRASALALGDGQWFAATAGGLLVSSNQGESWSKATTAGESNFYAVSVHGHFVAAAGGNQLWISDDAGERWWPVALPGGLRHVNSLTVTSGNEFWVGTRAGALRWRRTPSGVGSWELVKNGLPNGAVFSVEQDGDALLVAVSNSIYVSRDDGNNWRPEPPAAFELTGAVRQGDKLYAITQQHGILVREQPELASESVPAGTGVASKGASSGQELCNSRQRRCRTE